MPAIQTIAPCLWFDGQAEEAARFYVSVFPDSRIDHVHKSTIDWRAGKTGETGHGGHAADGEARRRQVEGGLRPQGMICGGFEPIASLHHWIGATEFDRVQVCGCWASVPGPIFLHF